MAAPPPPPGFQLDAPPPPSGFKMDAPPPPPGFKLDTGAAPAAHKDPAPPPPPGFVMDAIGATGRRFGEGVQGVESGVKKLLSPPANRPKDLAGVARTSLEGVGTALGTIGSGFHALTSPVGGTAEATASRLPKDSGSKVKFSGNLTHPAKPWKGESPARVIGDVAEAFTPLPGAAKAAVAGPEEVARGAVSAFQSGAKATKEMERGVKRLMAPATVSTQSLSAASSIRRARGTNQLQADQSAARLVKAQRAVGSKPVEWHRQLIDYVENRRRGGRPPDAAEFRAPKGDDPLSKLRAKTLAMKFDNTEQKRAADTMRDIYRHWQARAEYAIRRNRGAAPKFVEDYYAHIWKEDPDRVKNAMAAFYKQGSGRNFRRRSIPTIADGVAAGLTPKYENAFETTQHYVNNMARFLTTHDTQAALKEAGHASWHTPGTQPEGHVPLQGIMTERVPRRARGGRPAGPGKPEPGTPPLAIPGPLAKAKAANTFSGQARGAGSRVGMTQPRGTPASKRFSNFADTKADQTPAARARFKKEMFDRANNKLDFNPEKSSHEEDGFIYEVETNSRGETRVTISKDGKQVAAARVEKGMLDSIAVHPENAAKGDGARLFRFLDKHGIANTREIPDRSPGMVRLQQGLHTDDSLSIEDAAAKAENVTPAPGAEAPPAERTPDREPPKQILYAHPDVARVYNNFVSKGLAATQIGPLFKVVQATTNATKLAAFGLSWAHLGLVGQEGVLSEIAGALRSASRVPAALAKKDFGRATMHLRSAGGALRRAPVAPFQQYAKGRKFSDALLRGEGGPLHTAFANSGNQLHMPDVLKTRGAGSFYQSIIRGSLRDDAVASLRRVVGSDKNSAWDRVKGAADLVGNVVQSVAAPMMEHAIPHAKQGAWLNEMERWHAANPLATQEEIDAQGIKVTDSIDNRMGEMLQDNLFWHKWIKETAQIALQSYSFTAGTIRELGGGVKDIPESVKGIASGKGITNRTAYAAALAAYVPFRNAIYQYMKTGKPPQGQDFVAPRTGGKTPGGEPERAGFLGNEKDVYAYSEDPVREAANKQSGELHFAEDMATGKDWRNLPIAPPAGAPSIPGMPANWAEAYADDFASSFTPFALSAQRRKAGSNISGFERSFGVRPAPAYLANPEKSKHQKSEREMREWLRKVNADKKGEAQMEQP